MAIILRRTGTKKRADGTSYLWKSKWWYTRRPGGEWVKLSTDQRAAQRLANDAERDIEDGLAGFIDTRQLRKPVVLHLVEYVASIEAKGIAAKGIGTTRGRLQTLIEGAGWTTIRDITLDTFEMWVATARKTLGLAPKTINHYAASLTAFCRWAVERDRLKKNPIERFKRLNEQQDRRRERRALSLDEARRLIATSPELAIRGVRRRLVYHVAQTTGLRRGELGALEWGDVRLDGVVAAYIQLRAKTTKSKRPDAIPLAEEVAGALLDARPDDWAETDRVFVSIPTNLTYRKDLAAAGITYRDARGLVADFHAQRMTFCTRLFASGVPQRITQGLLRHKSATLTNQVYTDDSALPLREGVEALPSLVAETSVDGTEQATGTDGKVTR